MGKYDIRKINEPFIHVFAWTLLFFSPFIVSRSGLSLPMHEWGHMAVLYLAFMIIFYVNYCFLVDKLLFAKRDVVGYVVSNILLITVICLLLQYAHELFRPDTISHPVPPMQPPRAGKILNDLLFMVMFVGLSMLLKMVVRSKRLEIRNRELENERKEVELKHLKNQLNPHFVFNTLNNIYALIAIDGEKAQQVVMELSNLLRYVLYENKKLYVPVDKEINFVRDYIALMSIRQNRQTQVRVDINIEPCRGCYVAPLLFIPLIENAFKHGVNPLGESFVDIKIDAVDTLTIRCRVDNGYYPKDKNDCAGSGIGLENLKKQLDLLYPQRYSLLTEVVDKVYSASLTITLSNTVQS